MREKLGWVVAAILLVTSGLGAQGWSMTIWFQQTIAVQAERLERIKAHQPDPPLRGYLDAAWTQQNPQTLEPELRLLGWGFECGALDVDAVDLRLNGFVKDVTALVQRHARPDVASNAGLLGWCPTGIPYDSGMALIVPIGQLLPGQYAIRLRLWTADGQSHDTNTVWLYIS